MVLQRLICQSGQPWRIDCSGCRRKTAHTTAELTRGYGSGCAFEIPRGCCPSRPKCVLNTFSCMKSEILFPQDKISWQPRQLAEIYGWVLPIFCTQTLSLSLHLRVFIALAAWVLRCPLQKGFFKPPWLRRAVFSWLMSLLLCRYFPPRISLKDISWLFQMLWHL